LGNPPVEVLAAVSRLHGHKKSGTYGVYRYKTMI